MRDSSPFAMWAQAWAHSPRLELRPMPARFFSRDSEVVARELIGCVLVHDLAEGRTAGVIVETEAYDQSDAASHSFRGPTPRNRVMFGPAGFLYVYRSYGVHWCCNVVTGRPGHGAAVLLRALIPIVGADRMAVRRGLELSGADSGYGTGTAVRLCRGPGCVCAALAIDRSHDGVDLRRPPLFIARLPGVPPPLRLRVTPRIGITKAVNKRWRYCVAGDPHVSGARRLR